MPSQTKRYRAQAKTVEGDPVIVWYEADDFDDAKTMFRHELYETWPESAMAVRIDLRTVKEVPR